MKTTMFGEVEADGRRKVFWLHQHNPWSYQWVHKGWLMPPLVPDETETTETETTETETTETETTQ